VRGHSVVGNNTFLQVSNDWHIAGTRDFNGDGKSDILWRNDSGTVATWDMNDNQILSSHTFSTISNDWHLIG
jgi:serralysin